jgi:hypothetical protein
VLRGTWRRITGKLPPSSAFGAQMVGGTTRTAAGTRGMAGGRGYEATIREPSGKTDGWRFVRTGNASLVSKRFVYT